jgi:hypothetical protein
LLDVAQSGIAGRATSRVSESGSPIDVIWNMDEVRSSLRFMAEHGSSADAKAVVATARIFARTEDVETRHACLGALSQISNTKARAELLRISQRKDLDQGWRDLSAQYLSGTVRSAEPAISGSVTTTGGPD